MAQTNKVGIILMNLGSPDSTEVKDVRRYLMQFLMDKRVIDYPWLFRKILVGGLIVPTRAPKSAEAYKTIWTKQGSPLVVLTHELRQALQSIISWPVEVAMRYGNPTMDTTFKNLLKRNPGLQEVIAIPLYPHYAMSSYETAVEHAKKVYSENKYGFKLKFLKPFFDEPQYINALCSVMGPYLENDYDHLLFSYHGVPARHIKKTDPTGNHCLVANDCCNAASAAHKTCYRHQVFKTTSLVCRQLKIPAEKYSISFQSRLGKGWLEPFTDIRIEQLPGEGIKRLLVVCPAFVSDCLETLEEIAARGKQAFLKAGGESFAMIPCLNTEPLWVKALASYIEKISEGDNEMVLS